LKHLCKIYKGNKNSEKNKKKEQKKGGHSQTGPHPGPKTEQQASARTPLSLLFFLFLFLFHFAPTGGTHLSSPTFSRYSSLATDAADHAPLPLVNPQRKRLPDHAYK
jgi:hypothetical protein